jgi:putative PIN family toxin of toxin-antitoxin system
LIVLVDTNVFVSYLLTPQRPSAARTVVDLILDEKLAFIFLPEIEAELRRVTTEKPFFANRLFDLDPEKLIKLLKSLSAPPPTLMLVGEQWVRDPKGDYLVQAALAAEVDYLITGDKDLLELGAWSLELGAWSLELGAWSLELGDGVAGLEIRVP